MTKAERLEKIHTQAIREFDAIQSAVADERLQCLQDRRFYSIAGAQWEGSIGAQFENKPKIEVNKIHLSVIRIINEYRNNKISVDFIAQEKENSDGDTLADACEGLFRASEEASNADEAYDNAFEEAVGGGFAAFRLRAEWEDEEDADNDHQVIRFEPIFDADSCVFFDLGAKRQDKADAKHCFVIIPMTLDDYKATYGDDPSSWGKAIDNSQYDWATGNTVNIAEYYRVEETTTLIHTYRDVTGKEVKYTQAAIDADEGLEERLAATGSEFLQTRRVPKRRVRKYILSGGSVLEDQGYIAGPNIPIIPVYGKRWYVDGVERCMGHVRLAKDAQRLKNMQFSRLAEIAAMSTVEKPIFTSEQIAGHEVMWAEDNIKAYPYLLINPTTDLDGNATSVGPLAYTKPPIIPPAMAALLQLTDQDINDLLGNQQAAEEIVSNISGKAVELIQQRLDMQVYIYMSNFAKAMRRCGQVWLGMAKELYVEPERSIRATGKDGSPMPIDLGVMTMTEGGEEVRKYDLSRAKLDVGVNVGPASSTKRQSTVRALTGMMGMTSDPETMQVLSSMAMLNMEGEGLSDVRQYFRRKLVRMGAIKPTQAEIEEMNAAAAQAGPDANAIYLESAAANERAKAEKAQAETILTLAKTEQTRADAAAIMQDMDGNAMDNLAKLIKMIKDNPGAMGAGEITATAPPIA